MEDMLYEIFGSSGGAVFEVLQSLIQAVMGVTWISIMAAIGLVGAGYFFFGHVILSIGRKKGLYNQWMPFVPVARSIYELRIMDEPWWKVFFFKDVGNTLAILAGMIVRQLLYTMTDSAGVAITIGLIISIAYVVYSIICTFKWYYGLYAKFDFNPMLAVVNYVPGVNGIVPIVLDVLMAYDNNRTYGKKVQRPIGELRTGDSTHQATRQEGRIFGAGSGMYASAVFTLKHGETLCFGRDAAKCHVIFDQIDTEISGMHCRIYYDSMNNKYMITDCSKNGTFTADGRRLQAGIQVPLAAGTEIYLATKKNSFRLS